MNRRLSGVTTGACILLSGVFAAAQTARLDPAKMTRMGSTRIQTPIPRREDQDVGDPECASRA